MVERKKEVTHVFIFREGQPPNSLHVQKILSTYLKKYSISEGVKVIKDKTSQLPASANDVYLITFILKAFNELEGADLDNEKYDISYSVDLVGRWPFLERYGVAMIVRK